MRRFVIIGRTASASPAFSLEDLPSTSGRLDVLVRSVRAALLVSHGVRRDTLVYLVLLGGSAPKTLRFDGASARFLRPDERSLAINVQKALAVRVPAGDFCEVRPAIALAEGGLEAVLADLPACAKYRLELGGEDIRGAELDAAESAFFVGDHLGFDESTLATLNALGARVLSLGPVSLHAEDAVTLVANELDRRAPGSSPES